MIDAKKLRELEANLKKKANGGSYFIHLQIDYQETLDLIALAKKGLESDHLKERLSFDDAPYQCESSEGAEGAMQCVRELDEALAKVEEKGI